MGLGFLGAAIDAVSGNLKDQWKDVISCNDMTNNILMMKKTSKTGRITKKSAIIVNPGQMAVIVSSGQVLDATAQEGVYIYEEGAPSFFAGDFGDSFKDMWQRFTFGGGTPYEDCVFFINTTEILDNGFGTPAPVIYKDWEHAVMNARLGTMAPMSLYLRCNGQYTFKIEKPAVFLREIAGTASVYEKEELCDQMRDEISAAFQCVLNTLGTDKYRIPVSELASQTPLIKKIMQENVFDEDIRRRGIKLVSFIINTPSLTEESEEKITKWETGGDVYQQQGVLTESYAQAMINASNNANGAANGMMGLGLVNMAGGPMAGGTGMFGQNPMMGMQGMGMQNMQAMQQQNLQSMQQGSMQPSGMNTIQPQMQAQPQTQSAGAVCPQCGAQVSGKFCSECGTKIEAPKKKFCSNCGAEVSGKFCAECGTPAQ